MTIVQKLLVINLDQRKALKLHPMQMNQDQVLMVHQLEIRKEHHVLIHVARPEVLLVELRVATHEDQTV